MIQEIIVKGILKFADKSMGVDTNLFPKVNSNMVTPDLSKLTRPRAKVDVGKTSIVHVENNYGKAPARTVHDLKMSHEDKHEVELVKKADLSTKTDLSKKITDELLDEIREQQIELINRGLCPKCKVVTHSEGSTSNKRPRNQSPRPPSPPRRLVHN